MSTLKTRPTDASVDAFLAAIDNTQRREDCLALTELMRKLSGATPRLWGTGMVGFGEYHYRYASGREGDWFRLGFAPRKNDLTLYLMSGFDEWPELMAKLGKYKTGRSCLYLKRLDDADREVLSELIKRSLRRMDELYPDA